MSWMSVSKSQLLQNKTHQACSCRPNTIHIVSHSNWVRTVSRGKPCRSLVWKRQCHQLVDHVQERTLSNLQWVSGRLLSSLSRLSPTCLISASPCFYAHFFLLYAWRRRLQEFSEAACKYKSRTIKEIEKDSKGRREIEYQVAVEAGKKRLEEMLIRHILKVPLPLTIYTATS